MPIRLPFSASQASSLEVSLAALSTLMVNENRPHRRVGMWLPTGADGMTAAPAAVTATGAVLAAAVAGASG